MANHKSTIKAHKKDAIRRAHNREFRTRMRHALQSVRSSIDGGDSAIAKEQLRGTASLLDKLVTKGIIHANAAARYKSRLVRRLAKTSAPA